MPQAPQHPLMVKERTGSSVRPLQLAYMIYGGKAAFERMVDIQSEIEADPTFDRLDLKLDLGFYEFFTD